MTRVERRNMSSKLYKPVSSAAVATLATTLPACGGNAGPAPTSAAQALSPSTQAASVGKASAAYYQAKDADGFVNTLVGEKIGDGKVSSEEEARECLKGAMSRLGGDDKVELVTEYALQNAEGTTVYAFTQQAGGVLVEGSTAKLIVDKDGSPVGIVSSILPGVEAKPIAEWAIDEAGAEKVVTDQLASVGSKATLVKSATEKVIVPDPNQDGASVCAWVVYSFQADAEHEDGVYEANYVSAQGTYMYSMPVSGPGDPDAEKGESAKDLFDFAAYEPGETTVTVKHIDGTTEEVTVPVLKDAATGKTYLADAKRKIVCADTAAFDSSGQLVPVEVTDGADQINAHTYYTFVRVWDFFDSIGWTGPDGKGTPSLLLMDFVDSAGNPIDNAAYMTKMGGFQLFGFTHLNDYGECLDVVAHEFVHCLSTATTVGSKGNVGDTGAISEGYSDVMGNIVEMKLDGNAGAWIIAEGLGADKIMRNMANPHEYAQPEFAFDSYYAPKPPVATGLNDMGGVHTNSSLLAIVSYKLDQAGMSLEEQGYYWMNVALAMTSRSDYPMLAELMPWVMEQVGYGQHVDSLRNAIQEAGFSVTEDPGTVPEGCGSATFDFTDVKEAAEKGQLSLVFFKAPEANLMKRATTWPMEGTTVAKANLPAGDYFVVVQVGDESGTFKQFMALGKDGWKLLDGKDPETIKAAAQPVTVEIGKTLEIDATGFKAAATEGFQAIDQILAQMTGA